MGPGPGPGRRWKAEGCLVIRLTLASVWLGLCKDHCYALRAVFIRRTARELFAKGEPFRSGRTAADRCHITLDDRQIRLNRCHRSWTKPADFARSFRHFVSRRFSLLKTRCSVCVQQRQRSLTLERQREVSDVLETRYV